MAGWVCTGVMEDHPFQQPGHTLSMEEEIKQKSNLTVSGLNAHICSLYTCLISILIGILVKKGRRSTEDSRDENKK